MYVRGSISQFRVATDNTMTQGKFRLLCLLGIAKCHSFDTQVTSTCSLLFVRITVVTMLVYLI